MHLKPDVALFGVAVLWGSSYLAAKVAAESGGPIIALVARYAIATAGCLVVLLATRSPWPSRTDLTLGALLGLTQAAVIGLETWGVAFTSATNAGVLISLTILLTPLLQARLGGLRLPASFHAAGLVCVLGVAVLLGGAGWSGPRIGDLLIIVAAGVRAGHVALLGRLAPAGTVHPITLTFTQLLTGTLVFALATPLSAPSAPPDLSPAFWLAVLHLGLGCSALAFLAQTWAVQRTSPARASLLLGTEPVWAVAIPLALGAELPTATTLIGAALVIGAVESGRRIEARDRAAALHEKASPAPT